MPWPGKAGARKLARPTLGRSALNGHADVQRRELVLLSWSGFSQTRIAYWAPNNCTSPTRNAADWILNCGGRRFVADDRAPEGPDWANYIRPREFRFKSAAVSRGRACNCSAPYAMRVWLNPDRLTLQLTRWTSAWHSSAEAQVCRPASLAALRLCPPGHEPTLNCPDRLQSPSSSGQILLRVNPTLTGEVKRRRPALKSAARVMKRWLTSMASRAPPSPSNSLRRPMRSTHHRRASASWRNCPVFPAGVEGSTRWTPRRSCGSPLRRVRRWSSHRAGSFLVMYLFLPSFGPR